MKNRFENSCDNKRYYTFSYYLKKTYGKKVAKISLNTNFGCPNRDGSAGFGGCTFCSALGSGDFAGNIKDDLALQYKNIKERVKHKWPDSDYIAYFQAYTNTYAPLKVLKETFEPFSLIDEVKAISIATRPDCLSDEIITYLQSLTTKKDIWVEMGLQTTYDQSAKSFNRGYDYEVFVDTMNRLNQTDIKVCIHMINGLPTETKEMMLENVKRIAKIPNIHAVKIHMLHLLKDTKMANQYIENPWPLLSLEEYVELVVKQLTYLNKDVVIQRLTGDGKVEELVAPLWSLNKGNVLNSIDKYMALHDIAQGDNYQ
ncbi:TIGR01212 family radical SAM protein [Mycoplasma sp. P36-A1]|uniref:TIGR01212 family radical SAM protein n=1 Tax=Mycoplasma sp. P36-A1 TaxID=3252900 RepID=UPI003C2BC501